MDVFVELAKVIVRKRCSCALALNDHLRIAHAEGDCDIDSSPSLPTNVSNVFMCEVIDPLVAEQFEEGMNQEISGCRFIIRGVNGFVEIPRGEGFLEKFDGLLKSFRVHESNISRNKSREEPRGEEQRPCACIL